MDISVRQREALRLVVDGVLDAVRAAGATGAPGGVIYAALMGQGASFAQYTSLMGALERAGKVRREGECFFLAEDQRGV